MAHTVVDVAPEMDAVYGAVDAHGLTVMLMTSLGIFRFVAEQAGQGRSRAMLGLPSSKTFHLHVVCH